MDVYTTLYGISGCRHSVGRSFRGLRAAHSSKQRAVRPCQNHANHFTSHCSSVCPGEAHLPLTMKRNAATAKVDSYPAAEARQYGAGSTPCSSQICLPSMYDVHGMHGMVSPFVSSSYTKPGIRTAAETALAPSSPK